MQDNEYLVNRRYYKNTIDLINKSVIIPKDLCFVLVQHAFSPSIDFYHCIEPKIASVILKGSSAEQNPSVVAELKRRYGSRILDTVKRSDLEDSSFTIELLKKVTRGRPFVILEYGAYFAPSISAICCDSDLGAKLLGVVEGTDNGVKGSADGRTIGYSAVAGHTACPIISKSRSNIKNIMDIEIGPAIVEATDKILCNNLGRKLKHWRGTTAVVGVGSIGNGVLSALNNIGLSPLVHDTDLAVMAKLAHCRNRVVDQHTILAESDILFLSTGNCFLSQQPELLTLFKNNALLVLCTSGDVEAGIPQLINRGELQLVKKQSDREIAVYRTRHAKQLRVLFGIDEIGQAPNMSVEDGSASPANVMSDMEFYALGCYLASEHGLSGGKIHESPWHLQKMILKEWLAEFYPSTIEAPHTSKPLEHFEQRYNNTSISATDFIDHNFTGKKIVEFPESHLTKL